MPIRTQILSRRRVLTPAALGGLVATARPPEVTERQASSASVLRVGRREMAARVEVLLPGGADPADAIRALDVVSDVARRFTAFDPGSELGELNRHASSGPTPVAPDLFHLMRRAVGLSLETDGAFDIAAGALWRAWGFVQRHAHLPTTDEVRRARACSGFQHLVLDPDACAVAFRTDGVEVNLGAIGKGHAVDRAHAALGAAGQRCALVHAGFSSLRAWGDAPGGGHGAGWPVAVRHPSRWGRPLASLRLCDRAMGVSGVAERYVEGDGVRLGHVLDPRTGQPSARNALAVAWAPEATLADALSTAFFVMTPEEVGRYCARRSDIGALIVPGPIASGACEVFGAVPASLDVNL